MDYKADSKDKLILKELEKDARSQIKTISRRTGIPRDSVNYRINKLKKFGVIKGFAPICDTTKLGNPIYSWVNLQLQIFDDGTDKNFKAFLKNIPEIIYIAKVTGAYHYVLTIATEDISSFDAVLRTILGRFPNLIKSYNTSLMVEEVQYDTFHRLIK